MTDETKKYLAIGLAVICVSVAGIVFYRSMFGSSAGGTTGNRNIVLLCTKCGGFEIPIDKFREHMSNNPTAITPGIPGQPMAVPCPKCSEKTCYIAQKCSQCGHIFVFGQAKDQKYPDRCPQCRFSAMENRQKK